MLTWKTVGAVIGGWLLVGLLWGAQSTFAAGLRGEDAALTGAIVTAMVQVVPWIPMTLAVAWLTLRFPLSSAAWRSSLAVHLAAFPLVAWMANVLVVLGFWIVGGQLQGISELAGQGVYWAAQRIHFMALVYAAVAGVTQLLRSRRDLRARELALARQEGQLARARLEALTAQLRPHFLSNTLHTIGQLWRSGRADEADGLLDRLGALFQRVQSNTRRLEVPLEEELSMVRDYLELERARFHDRLRVEVDADPEALPCAVPPLLLQPLVENAIRHGISARSSAGRLAVTARRANGRLTLTVEDDGPGIDAPARTPGSGTGLSNTRERLEQMYGSEHEMRIETPEGGGTRVRLELPARVPTP